MSERLKMLIVEDSLLAQSIYDEVLEGSIFEKRFADNGEEALDIYYSWKPEIILLDILLPEVSGYEVLKKIRSQHMDFTTAIIMTTGLSRKDDVLDCVKLGIQGYIVKPPDYGQFTKRVLEYFGKLQPERTAEILTSFNNVVELS